MARARTVVETPMDAMVKDAIVSLPDRTNDSVRSRDSNDRAHRAIRALLVSRSCVRPAAAKRF
jgi:hypothetical protein